MKSEAVLLTTTLNRLREHGACVEGYEKLLRHLGGPSFDHNAPINLLTILESNGVDDCLWALRATEQNCTVVARLMACDFAEAVLPIWESAYPSDTRPREAIAVSRRYARGSASVEELAAARVARAAAWNSAWLVWDAARVAAWDSARDSAWDSARAAAMLADDAAWDAASDAAYRSDARDAVRSTQAQIIHEYLIGDEE